MSGQTSNSRGAAAPRGSRMGGLLETACWTLGLILIALYFSARTYGEIERQEAIATFAQRARLPAMAEADGARDAGQLATDSLSTDRAPDQMEWSASRIRARETSVAASADSRQPVALLRIRSAKLEVPVYDVATERNLNRGAGLIAGTAAPDSDGNIAIAAHRDGYFRALERVALGDIVEIETLSRRRLYRITELAIVPPTDISPLHELGVPAVTLVTCYPFYFVGNAPQRYIVRAVAVE